MTRLFALFLLLGACTPAPAPTPSPLPAPAPAPAPTPSLTTSVTIASWNIRWLHARDGTGRVKREEADYQRLAGYAAVLDADIVALQEVNGSAAARRVFDPAIYAFHFPDDGHVQQAGFAVKKSIPVEASELFDALDVGYLREGVDITVRVGNERLRLLGVHL